MGRVKRWRHGVWRPSPVAGALLVANTAVFLGQMAQGPAGYEWFVRYGLIPAVLFQGDRFSIPGAPTPYPLTLLTSSFLHGNPGHLAINLAFIAALGSLVERAIGGWRFAAIWTGSVVFGGSVHALLNSGSIIPTIGASAGVAGLIGVVTVGGWAGLVAGGLWLSVQVIGALARVPEMLAPDVAWQAHLGGFAIGITGGLLVRWELQRRLRQRRQGGAASSTDEAGPASTGGRGRING